MNSYTTMMADSTTSTAEIDEIANSMARDLCYVQLPDETFNEKGNSFQIHRVHRLVRQIDWLAYEPSVVSIGPYHQRNASLQFMERLKWKCLDYVLKLNCKKNIRDYLLAVSDIENQARACYSDEVILDSKNFRQMLLLDGCFILVYLGGTHGISRITKANAEPNIISDNSVHGTRYAEQQANRSPENSAKISPDSLLEIELGIADGGKQSSENEDSVNCHENNVISWYHSFAMLDVFLSENQIPFFVVRKLHDILVDSAMENTVTENVYNFVEHVLQSFTGASGPTYERPNDFCHILHLCHIHFIPRMLQEESNHLRPQFGEYFLDKLCKVFNINHRQRQDNWNLSHNQDFDFLQCGQVSRWRRATQYHEAGIVFKRKNINGLSTHSLLDITFKDGVLEIPCLYVENGTGSLFRNMIAFEQTNPQFGNCVTAYVMFMSQLICKPEDVTLVSQRGIMVHVLHSDKVVSALFTRLTKGVVFDFIGNFYLKSVCWRMEMYYQNRINRWIAWLRHNHLSNPWLGAALLTGLLVLFCTIAQTVLTVLAYVGPP